MDGIFHARWIEIAKQFVETDEEMYFKSQNWLFSVEQNRTSVAELTLH